MTAGELVARMAAGDRAALPVFYDRLAPLAWRRAREIVGDAEGAAHVLQEAMWDAWQLAHLHDPGQESAEDWIVGLTESRALEWARSWPAARRSAARDARAADAAAGDPADVPPVAVRHALLARLEVTKPPAEPRVGRRTWLRWGAATGAVSLAAALLTAGYVAARYEARIGELARETARVRERLRDEHAALPQTLSTTVVELLREPGTRVLVLEARGRAARAGGRVVWNDATGGVLLVADLPPPPRDEIYEAWIVTAAGPRHAGTLSVDAGGRAELRLAPLAGGTRVDAVTVTREAHRVPTPTGPVVLASR